MENQGQKEPIEIARGGFSMLNFGRCALACAVLGFGLSARPALSQDMFPKPGPEHEVLKQDVGTWDATVEMMFEPGAPPQVSKGTETITVMDGGLWTVVDFKGTMMNAPFHGHGTNGFDSAKKKYVSTWVDSMSVGLNIGESTYDKATKTMKGRLVGSDPAGNPMTMNGTTVWKDADTRVFTLGLPGPDGKEITTMRITYKRRK
jgi:hypothetical protein